MKWSAICLAHYIIFTSFPILSGCKERITFLVVGINGKWGRVEPSTLSYLSFQISVYLKERSQTPNELSLPPNPNNYAECQCGMWGGRGKFQGSIYVWRYTQLPIQYLPQPHTPCLSPYSRECIDSNSTRNFLQNALPYVQGESKSPSNPIKTTSTLSFDAKL